MEIFKAVGLAAGIAFEMHVIVVMIILAAPLAAERVAGTFVVEYFVENAFFQKSFQRPVNRHPVETVAQRTFQIPV